MGKKLINFLYCSDISTVYREPELTVTSLYRTDFCFKPVNMHGKPQIVSMQSVHKQVTLCIQLIARMFQTKWWLLLSRLLCIMYLIQSTCMFIIIYLDVTSNHPMYTTCMLGTQAYYCKFVNIFVNTLPVLQTSDTQAHMYLVTLRYTDAQKWSLIHSCLKYINSICGPVNFI